VVGIDLKKTVCWYTLIKRLVDDEYTNMINVWKNSLARKLSLNNVFAEGCFLTSDNSTSNLPLSPYLVVILRINDPCKPEVTDLQQQVIIVNEEVSGFQITVQHIS